MSIDGNRVEGQGSDEGRDFTGLPQGFKDLKDGMEAAGPETAGVASGGDDVPGFLELVYGVLFEPVGTMQRVARKPPLLSVALIVTILSFFGALMSIFIAARVIGEGPQAAPLGQLVPAFRAMTPLAAILGLFGGYLKWFGYSAVLHLAADLLGGRGGARGVFAVVGLAGLPAILLIPVQFLAYQFGGQSAPAAALAGLAGLAVWMWGIVLLVIGLKQVHGLSTGRSLLVIFSPYLALGLLLAILLAAVIIFAASLPLGLGHFPGYF